MRILLIAHELGYRGTPRFLLHCALCAHEARHDVCVWGLDDGGFAGKICVDRGIRVLVGQEALKKAIAFGPNVVHVHRAGACARAETDLIGRIKLATGCRILETSVFGLADFTGNSPIDLHAHISQWDLWRWRRWLWPLHQPGILLPYCLDTDVFHPTVSEFRAQHHIPADAFLIGRLGKTDWDTLSCALCQAMAKCDSVWVATVDDYSATTRLPALLMPFANRIVTIPRLTGAEELNQFHSACNITVNFSPIGESFGYGIAESMSCGTPVVVLSKPRNDNAQIELAAPEHGGFPVSDALSAAETFIDLATDRATLECARAKCRASIERRYSRHVLGSQILKAYSLLASSNRQGKKLESLFEDNGFLTKIGKREIFRQLGTVRGRPLTRFNRIKMLLAYSLPNALRIHLKIKS